MNKPQLLVGFAVKVLLGLLYGYLFLHYYNGDDTWKFFRASLNETDLLLNNTRQFFINEFTPANALATGRNTAEVIEIYLNDLQYVLVVKTMAVFNIVSRGNYYINVVFFNAIVFFGHVWLYTLMTRMFPSKKNVYYVIIILFLPAVFWLSGIRVDGWLFFFVSLLLYNVCGKSRPRITNWMIAVIAFIGIMICRLQFAMLIMPAIAAYMVAKKTGRTYVSFSWVYGFAILLFFMPASGLTSFMAARQQEFMRLNGTKFRLDALDASPFSYLKVLPQSVVNTFVRPFPWEAKGLLQLLASAEVALFWIIVIISLYRRHPYWQVRLREPVILMLLIFGISVYVFTGLLVPYPGALVRYKAIPELLMLCAVASLANYGETTNYKKL